eukprot:gnl/MRDRNA2_/MRDRNA2_24157_c0_seq1.p1 gnl/MRDRNA2_/MRDRNA2_24157_c0~~gnl/MRDRNA2_/MRDRNA2_24157_c0_seq1.p1  ORF type:complete len:151 (+),score=18.95 gnl/MRDRNA2_/MRDRNA2_24157_c0_seq1:69-521(+)
MTFSLILRRRHRKLFVGCSAIFAQSQIRPFWGGQPGCESDTNAALIDRLRYQIGLPDRVAAAMRKIDRKLYVPDVQYAYEDRPLPIGHGATISAPHMHAHSLKLLAPHLQPGCTVLDVGCGSGYLTAVMAELVGREGWQLARLALTTWKP